MRFKNKIFLLFLYCLWCQPCKSQDSETYWIDKFDASFYGGVVGKGVFNDSRYFSFSKSGDAHKFIALSYVVNALNIMYKATGNIKYLETNRTIIKNVIDNSVKVPLEWSGKKADGNRNGNMKAYYNAWLVRSNAPKQIFGRDWMLYEGYFFRYVGQYLYILHKNHLEQKYSVFRKSYDSTLAYVENDVWGKWKNRSLLEKSSLTRFFASRIHMGSHWAALALYLEQLTSDTVKFSEYKTVIDTYNILLKNNLQLKVADGHVCYVWHAAYDSLPNESPLNKVIQFKKQTNWGDISHGNQVVSYVLAAYWIDSSTWKARDITRLINTAKYINWLPQESRFKDTFAGKSNFKELQGVGWKQSDGWLKLASYDRDLLNIYKTFYRNNYKKIDYSYLSLQFYAQMAYSCNEVGSSFGGMAFNSLDITFFEYHK